MLHELIEEFIDQVCISLIIFVFVGCLFLGIDKAQVIKQDYGQPEPHPIHDGAYEHLWDKYVPWERK